MTTGSVSSTCSMALTFNEIPVFARRIGLLDVDEEEVVLGEMLLQRVELILHRTSRHETLHAHQPRRSRYIG